MTHKDHQNIIGDITIETISKSIFKETTNLGFRQNDYIKLANSILEKSIRQERSGESTDADKVLLNTGEKITLPVEDQTLRIRKYDPVNDHDAVKRWINDEYGRFFLLSRTTSRISEIEELIENPNNYLGTVTTLDDKPIGLLGFLDYDEVHKKAELRKLIGEKEFRGKGYAREATLLWIGYGLTTLGLRKIYLNTLDTHLANIKLNKELGFEVEGIFKKEIMVDGRFTDVLRMAYIVSE